jgi:hypothetical protein
MARSAGPLLFSPVELDDDAGVHSPAADLATRRQTVPVQALLRPLLAASPHGDLAGLIHVTDDVSDAMAVLTSG